MKVAPAFDFNSAFTEIDDIKFYYVWIATNLAAFMRNNADLKESLESIEFDVVVDSLSMLTEEQRKNVRNRAKFLYTI
jgi:hypothetical protein